MSASPPAKRQRQDVEITRSEIWHPDGSVVLQVGNTQFRVHWSVLSRHSSFFRDLQRLPQPPEQPSIEGCPVVELSDRVEDVKRVLETLYNPLFFAQKAIPLRVIASHVRLCRKYDLSDILQTIVERLTHENPTSLEEYDALITPGTGAYMPTRITPLRGLYFDTVTLARENNLLSVLPCAYYRVLLSSSPTGIFDGAERGDGTLATLSTIDQRRCSAGRAAILRLQWDAGNTFGWIQESTSVEETGCTDLANCRRKKLTFFKSTDSLNLCHVCTQDAKTKIIAGRQKMWELLPTFFDLPPWDELKNEL
ncbi:hypothetical protein FB451DRAFT_1057514 [Mycena latifolia]|nr:hypothetical protein FB451DRAFT_1057514 [Mycena latifolia]